MNIVITGGTRGIGFNMAKEFIRHGHTVTICGTSDTGVERAINELTNAYGVKCDVTNNSDIINLLDFAVNKMGTIDIWINNAGIGQGKLISEDLSLAEIEKIIDVDLIGMIKCSKTAVNYFQKQNRGHIYNMEGFGSDGMKMPIMSVYGTAKYGLTYFSKVLAKELKNTNVKVTRISPGMVKTEFSTPKKEDLKIINKLSDTPEVVSKFLVEKILKNKKSGNGIIWLTKLKVVYRLLFR